MALLPRSYVRKQWDMFCDNHPDAWFWHTNAWLDYCLAYTPGSIDYSAIETNEYGELVKIEPKILLNDQAVYGGRELATPLQLNICLPKDQVSYQIIDLMTWQPTEMRKSYRGLVRQQSEQYNFLVLDDEMARSRAGFDSMLRLWMQDVRGVHIAEAGRETRPQITWDLMTKWIEERNACCTIALSGWTVVGYTYCIMYKQKAYYASGATIADCGHALQFKTIQYLKQKVWSYYELGAQGQGATEKECAIEFFKRGFGGCCSTTAEH